MTDEELVWLTKIVGAYLRGKENESDALGLSFHYQRPGEPLPPEGTLPGDIARAQCLEQTLCDEVRRREESLRIVTVLGQADCTAHEAVPGHWQSNQIAVS